jgi:hypothetical protein
MTDFDSDIAVLLPTRARTTMVERSVKSLFELAENPDKIEIIFGYDNDDTVGFDYFDQTICPWMDANNVTYSAMKFKPLGYIQLNKYVNAMAKTTRAKWYIIWNDDAVMRTVGWDTEIMAYDGKFNLLAFHTHNQHPYSIFPIIPYKWFEILGYLCPHQISDAWTSQQAYMLNIFKRIDVVVKHDRFDLTGNNKDSTFANRPMLEKNPFQPGDFNHVDMTDLRVKDCIKLAQYMKSIGMDVQYFENILNGKQDPWEMLVRNDVNRQQVQWKIDHNKQIVERPKK